MIELIDSKSNLILFLLPSDLVPLEILQNLRNFGSTTVHFKNQGLDDKENESEQALKNGKWV